MDYSGLRRIQHSASTDELKLYRKSAFTLAEVLITLGIIGIVAAMTIPTLVQNYQTQERVTKLKKTYSTLSNAYSFMLKDYGEPALWPVDSFEDLATLFSKYMRTSAVCTQTNYGYKQCSCGGSTSRLTGLPANFLCLNNGSLLLEDGMYIYFGHPSRTELTGE